MPLLSTTLQDSALYVLCPRRAFTCQLQRLQTPCCRRVGSDQLRLRNLYFFRPIFFGSTSMASLHQIRYLQVNPMLCFCNTFNSNVNDDFIPGERSFWKLLHLRNGMVVWHKYVASGCHNPENLERNPSHMSSFDYIGWSAHPFKRALALWTQSMTRASVIKIRCRCTLSYIIYNR